ncbi:MAG: TIGR02147 family protein [Chitinispirillaceae bacterium]|nr:TIGR02147 family protein [Chitinispirillaceae bacterium]
MPNLFDYTDYRKFLQDYQKEEHAKNSYFSHRYFAQKAGFSSSGLLANIMKGRRNLTDALIGKFSRALKFDKKEGIYFESLVRFNQAASIEDRNKYYSRMLQAAPLKALTISRERHEFYARWWYSAIRELLNYYRFKDDYRALARQLDPPISSDQARDAISTLERLGMIKRDAAGYCRQTATIITTGERHERSLNVTNFQIAAMELAKESLQRHSNAVRDISTLTLTLSPASVRKARAEIAAIQKKLLTMAEEDRDVDAVYQFNVQMFPLTKIEKEK